MRRTLLAWPLLLMFASSASAGTLYSACFYNNDQHGYSMTPLFTLKPDAIRAYGQWTYEKTLEWEQKVPNDVRGVSSYASGDFVGQFVSYADKHKTSGGSSQALCVVTTQKSRARAWYNGKVADGRFEETLLKQWRPSRDTFSSVESWSGTVLASPEGAQREEPANAVKKAEERLSDGGQASAPSTPNHPKKSNAQADAEYAAAKAEYERTLAANDAEYKRAQLETERKKAEQRETAKRALAEYQRQLQAHDIAVRNQQLEYQKMAAKPADAPNAVYRGFTGPDCAFARRSATNGAGTSSGTRFKEVSSDTSSGHCVVQGWWWNTSTTGSSRQ